MVVDLRSARIEHVGGMSLLEAFQFEASPLIQEKTRKFIVHYGKL